MITWRRWPTRSRSVPVDRWLRVALAIWAILAFLAVSRAALYHLSSSHRGAYGVFAEGGRHWLRGEPLYDAQHPGSLCVFRYSPLVAVACVPLGLLPDPLGSALLRAVGLLVLFPALGWWARTTSPVFQAAKHRAFLFLGFATMVFVAVTDV